MSEEQRTEKAPGESGDAPSKGPWSKLKVTAILGALGVIVTVLTQVNQVIDQGKALVKRFSSASDQETKGTKEAKGAGGGGAQTYTVEMKWLSSVPYSLANLTSSKEFPHWAWLVAENREAAPLDVVVEVEVVGGPARHNVITAGRYRIPAHGQLARPVHPAVEFTNTDFRPDLPLKLAWTVKTITEPQRALGSDTTDPMPILAKDVVPWGLQSASGGDIPRDFLIASLAAWAYTPESRIEQRARTVANRLSAVPDPPLRLRRFMQQVYDGLFTADGVKVQSRARAFPPKGDELVRTPARVLTEHNATALEAALLVAAHRAALGADLRGRVVLLALPAADGAPDPKVFLLAWSSEGRDWEAIEMNQASTLAFEANRVAATTRTRAVFDERADMRAALETAGVFLAGDQRVVALGFHRARKHFSIRALP